MKRILVYFHDTGETTWFLFAISRGSSASLRAVIFVNRHAVRPPPHDGANAATTIIVRQSPRQHMGIYKRGVGHDECKYELSDSFIV